MPYTVPQNIDPNKIFLVNYSDLEGRWDPVFTLYNKHVKNEFEFPLVQLKDVLIKSPQYGTAECGIERKAETEPRYIRITDIDELGNLIDGLGATAEKLEEQYILNDGDILFARSGATVGKTYLHKTLPYQCFFAGYMIRIVVDKAKILPEYLFVYTQLQPYKDWIKAIQRTAAQPNINAEEYKSLPVPLPTIPIQQQIVNDYNAALSQRKKKLNESKSKLASIDQYLLDKLGITLPEDSHEKTFIVNYKDVDGGRLDPYSHKPYFSSAFENIKREYDLFSIKQISLLITSGITPLSGSDAYTNRKEGVAFVRSGDIDINGNIDFDNLLYIKHNIHNAIMKSSQVQKNDIMIAIVGATIGRIGIYYSNEPANINQAIALVRLKENFLPDYIKEVLQSSIGQLNLDKMKRPVARANINLDEIGQIIIPIPPINKQQEIADHISTIRAEAKAMEDDANTILEQAKKEVQELILGYFS